MNAHPFQLLKFPKPAPKPRAERAELFDRLQSLVDCWPEALDLIERAIDDLLTEIDKANPGREWRERYGLSTTATPTKGGA